MLKTRAQLVERVSSPIFSPQETFGTPLEEFSSPVVSSHEKTSTPRYLTRRRRVLADLNNTPSDNAYDFSFDQPLKKEPALPENIRAPYSEVSQSSDVSFTDTPEERTNTPEEPTNTPEERTNKRISEDVAKPAKRTKAAVKIPGTDQSPRFIKHANDEELRPIQAESPTITASGFPASVYTPGGTRLVLRTSLKSLATYGEEALPASIERPGQPSGDHEAEVLSATVKLTPEYIRQLSRDRVRSPSQQQAVAHEFIDRDEAVASEHAKKVGMYQDGDTWQWLHLIAFMLLRNEAQQSGNLAAGLRGSNLNMIGIEKMALEFAKNFAEVNLTVNALLAPGTRIAKEFEYLIEIPGKTLRFVIPAFDRKSDRTLRPAFRAMTKYCLQKATDEADISLSSITAESSAASESSLSESAQEQYLENLLDIVLDKTQQKDFGLRNEPSSPTTYRQDPGKRLMPAMMSSTAVASRPGKLGLRKIPAPVFSPAPAAEAGLSQSVAEQKKPFSPESPLRYSSAFFGAVSPIKLTFEDGLDQLDKKKDIELVPDNEPGENNVATVGKGIKKSLR